MMVFVDTSAFLAVLDADDTNHRTAARIWEKLLKDQAALVCSSYVLVETFALVQRRLGMKAVRVLDEDILPLVKVEWIGEDIHQQAVSAVLVANRRNLSLVDCASFAVMRRLGIREVFTFDKHFLEQGFETLPPRDHV